MVRKVFFNAIIGLGLIGAFAFSDTKSTKNLPVLETGEQSPHTTMMFYTPPSIKNVSVSPQPPKAGSPATVNAEIFNDPAKTDFSHTTSALLRYTTDGGKTFKEIKMTQGKTNAKIWSGAVPAQKAGTHLTFYLTAYDDTGNLTIEHPPTVKSFPPPDSEMLLVSQDPDDPDWLPDDLDLLKLWVGYDAENIYTKVQVQGAFTKQAKDIFRIHGYFVAIINPDTSGDIELMGTKALLYAPAVRAALGVDPWGLYDFMSIDKGAIKDSGYERVLDLKKAPNVLYMKCKRSALGQNPSLGLKLNAMTMGIVVESLGGDDMTPAPWDAMNYTMFYMRGHDLQF